MTKKYAGLPEIPATVLATVGVENLGDYYKENSQVARHFSGAYTIAEVSAILKDMQRVQKYYDTVMQDGQLN